MQTTNYKGSVAYVWSHFALRPIQQGIQSSHCIVELVNNANEDSLAWYWGLLCKTTKFLDGGNSRKLRDTSDLIKTIFHDSGIPHASFCEDADTLDGIMTSTGVILPGDVVELLEHADESEDINKAVASLLIKNYGIKAKVSDFRKLVHLITRSRWAG